MAVMFTIIFLQVGGFKVQPTANASGLEFRHEAVTVQTGFVRNQPDDEQVPGVARGRSGGAAYSAALEDAE